MLRHTGRAALEIGETLHRVCHFLLTVAVLSSLALVAGAWRLSRGPVDLGFLKNRIETAVNTSIAPAHVTLGAASIAWGGFSRGLDQPLILRVTDLTVDESAGDETAVTAGVHIPVVEAALSARWLFIGRVLPRSITLLGARLVLTRAADGSISFNIGGVSESDEPSPLTGLLAVLAAPAETDLQAGGGRFSQLSAVSIRGVTLVLNDRLLGMTWSGEQADIALSRHPGGGMDGRAKVTLVLGQEKAILTGHFALAPAARSVHAAQSVHVVASLSQVTPRALAAQAPVLAPLAALDVPLTLDGEADLGTDLTPSRFRVTARAETGKIHTGSGSIPIHSARFVVAGSMEQADIETGVVELQPAPNAAISTITAGGHLTHAAGRLGATLHLTLDHADFTNLAALWPADIAPNARSWLVANVQVGTAHGGKADLVLDASDTAPVVALTQASATLEGDGIAVSWLPTVPRVEQAKAHLVLTDADTIEIDVRSAQQRVNGGDSIAIPNGRVRITGLAQKDQVATIQCDANGSLPSAITLLKEPRLRILDRHPMDLRAPAGEARFTIHAVVPLERNLQIDDVTIRGTGTLSKAHLSGILSGRDLDDGTLSLDVDTNHLTIKGTGVLAGIQANLDGSMDFRAGPPSQVLQRYQATGRATPRMLAGLGLDTSDVLNGELGFNLILSEYRNGDGDLTAEADLTQSEVIVAPLGWLKPIGGAAKASARATLSKDKLTGIDRIVVDGAGIQLRGAATAAGGKPDTIRLDRAILGRTDFSGTIRLPRDGPIGVDLSGPVLDASAKLLEKSPKRDPGVPESAGPSWSIRGRFDRVLLAHDQIATQVMVAGDSDGQVLRELGITGRTGSGKAFSMRIGQVPADKGRATRPLAINAEDAGSLLQGLDVTGEIKGGVLTIAGDFDDTTPRHTLSGTLDIVDFRAIHAPGLIKLLQAVTLYGLVDAMGGPGMSFSRLTLPFQFDNDTLVLHDARAFSPSLGLTAKGRIDRASGVLDLEGTLVPAYVFNSVLGRIPLIGGLFSAEKGGGLFAMNYSLRGPMDNPSVVANPLSALTPGFLRGMFGLFDQAQPNAQTPANVQAPLDRPASGGNAQQR